jgi:hypothetical protein
MQSHAVTDDFEKATRQTSPTNSHQNSRQHRKGYRAQYPVAIFFWFYLLLFINLIWRRGGDSNPRYPYEYA